MCCCSSGAAGDTVMSERVRAANERSSEAAWDLDALVGALSEARNTAAAAGYKRTQRRRAEARRRERPSPDTLLEIMRGLRAALFPAHFGVSDFSESSLDAFVRAALDTSLHSLIEQVRRDLAYNAARASAAHLTR